MALIVQKYGGTSVGDLNRIRNVAHRVQKTRREGNDVVVVVSAMAGETDRLIQLCHQACDSPGLREYDCLISTGEQVSAALLAITLQSMGVPARSFLGPQVRIITDSAFSTARIQNVEVSRLRKELKAGVIPVVTGFQGVDKKGDITTLGRGGSDTTGVALAAALKADVCEIYTDVEGVYTTDPNICPEARKIWPGSPMMKCWKWPLWAPKFFRFVPWSLPKNTMFPFMCVRPLPRRVGLGSSRRMRRWKEC